MTVTSLSNFAARLVQRLGVSSCLIDAATGETIGPPDLPRLVSRFGGGLISAGLRKGDRILIGCLLSPSSGIAYLGAMYAGLVPVPVEEGALVSSGEFWAQGLEKGALMPDMTSHKHGDPVQLFGHYQGHPAEQPT